MRTVMLAVSVAIMAAGVFCVANSSAAFLSVAFIIGLTMLVLGASEIIVSQRADFERDEMATGFGKEGFRTLILALVIISGQITDDNVAQMLFGLFIATEGILSFRQEWLDVKHIPADQRVRMTISMAMLILGTYFMFNISVFKLPATLLIGVGMIILGTKTFIQSNAIEYIKPGFITGKEERLLEAQEEEKRALAKAKEGIREQKIAQRRIKKIEQDIAAEKELIMDAQFRKAEKEAMQELEDQKQS